MQDSCLCIISPWESVSNSFSQFIYIGQMVNVSRGEFKWECRESVEFRTRTSPLSLLLLVGQWTLKFVWALCRSPKHLIQDKCLTSSETFSMLCFESVL